MIQTRDVSFVVAEAISYDIPFQRVLMELPVLLERHDMLACSSRKSRISQCSVEILVLSLFRNKTPLKTFGTRLDLLLCEYIATSHPGLVGMCDELDTEFSLSE